MNNFNKLIYTDIDMRQATSRYGSLDSSRSRNSHSYRDNYGITTQRNRETKEDIKIIFENYSESEQIS